MSFIKSAILGAGLALILGILGIIPLVNMCVCFVNPFILVIGGYILCSFTGIKTGDYGALGINLIVYSVAGSVVGAIISFLMQMLGLGFTAVGGADLTTLGVNAAGGIVGVILGFIFQALSMLIMGGIGGLVYMFTKK